MCCIDYYVLSIAGRDTVGFFLKEQKQKLSNIYIKGEQPYLKLQLKLYAQEKENNYKTTSMEVFTSKIRRNTDKEERKWTRGLSVAMVMLGSQWRACVSFFPPPFES